MSNYRQAARRDDNEEAIVEALRAAGASVVYRNGKGEPDLDVGYNGRDFKLEVKHASSSGKTVRRTSGGRRPDARGLTQDQQDWWAAWKGAPPVIVHTPAEALAAIGAPPATPPAHALAELPAAGAPAPLATWRCSGCDLVYPDADGLELESGVAPPIHWTETPTRPWPLCPGFGKPGKPLAAIGAAP